MLPISKNAIMRKIHSEQPLTKSQRLGALLAIGWIEDNLDCRLPQTEATVPDNTEKMVKAIRDTIREDLGQDPDTVFSPSRRRPAPFLRACAYHIFCTQTGYTQRKTMTAFGDVNNRATYPYCEKVVRDLTSTYAEYRDIYETMKAGTLKRMAHHA